MKALFAFLTAIAQIAVGIFNRKQTKDAQADGAAIQQGKAHALENERVSNADRVRDDQRLRPIPEQDPDNRDNWPTPPNRE